MPAGDRAAGSFVALRTTVAWIGRLPVRAASGLVWVYQKTASPALVVLDPTGGCRFAPTCSHYARGALAEHGLIAGAGLTLRRLAKCGPWHPGGEDPVPPRARPVCNKVSAA
ncbi:MAG: membrane protein insertion efficiency factor YidD [Opitutae bacterium]|nr:membrane protein insertion efficiency factor YidD [Opitutae bacterium]